AASIDQAVRARFMVLKYAQGVTPHHARKARKLGNQNRSLVQRAQETHNLCIVHPPAEQFLHHGFGFSTRKNAARFQLLDQQNCRACGHFAAFLAPLAASEETSLFCGCTNSSTDGSAMKIHEYQAKAILTRYGVTTPRGEVAYTKEEAREAAQRLKSHVVVVKAQIHAGGRGKGGGVKLARSGDEAAEIAGQILGMNLVTPQTGPSGRIVKRVLIEECLDIKRELYLGLLVDRASGLPVFMASAAGGMEIEEVA